MWFVFTSAWGATADVMCLYRVSRLPLSTLTLTCVLPGVVPQQDEYHMMHLVCASHSPPGSPVPQGPPTARASDASVSISTPTVS